MRHRLLLIALFWLWSASATQATVIFSQDFESFAVNDECTAILAGDGRITLCRDDESAVPPPDLSYLRVKNAVAGSSESLPSGSKVLFSRVRTSTVQGDVAIQTGGSAGYLPADFWFQIALYINNTGSEVTNITASRPFKFFYPCEGSYPCPATWPGSGAYMYFLLQTIKNTSGAPLCDTSLNSLTDGSMYLFLRDNTVNASSPVWDGNGPVCGLPDNYLGQTSIAEWIKPGRWNIIKVHGNFTSSTGANFEAWIGPKGGTLVKVMNWISDTTIEGYAFDWNYAVGDGSHTNVTLFTSHPVNVALGVDSFMYIDDYYIATSESDLPTYGSSTDASLAAVVIGRMVRFIGLAATWWTAAVSYSHLILVSCWLWMQRQKVACAISFYRYRLAMKRWQRQAPTMIADYSNVITILPSRQAETLPRGPHGL